MTRDPYKIFNRSYDRRRLARLAGKKYTDHKTFAADLELHHERVYRYLFEGSIPSIPTMKRICQVLNCHLDDIAPRVDLPQLTVAHPPPPVPAHGRYRYFQKGRA